MAGTGIEGIESGKIQRPTGESRKEYLPLLAGQTVCTVKNDKGENCFGHLKQWYTAQPEAVQKAAPGNTLHRCQRCHSVYEGPPQEYLHPKAGR